MLKHPDYQRRQSAKLNAAPVTRICAICGSVLTFREGMNLGTTWSRHVRKCRKRAAKRLRKKALDMVKAATTM